MIVGCAIVAMIIIRVMTYTIIAAVATIARDNDRLLGYKYGLTDLNAACVRNTICRCDCL
jgi:hypothetical protein